MLKALSLWQPYAGAIPLGYKTLETRGWPTKYRGKLLIASTAYQGKKMEPVHRQLANLIEKQQEAPPGYVNLLSDSVALAIVDLKDCFQVQHAEETEMYSRGPTGFLGDFAVGRWIWELDNIQPLESPVFGWKGRQGLYNVTQEQIALILKHNPTLVL